MTQQRLGSYLRHGQTPFFRLETVDHAAAQPYAGADAVLLGVPYDGGVTYQPGARLAPYHVRRVSALVGSYHPAHACAVFDRLRVVDGGNVPTPPFHPGAVREAVQADVAAILAAGAAPVVVGGDHSVTLPCLRAVAQAHGPVAVIHVDAHYDTSGADAWGEPYHHGTPIRHALEEGLIAPRQLYQLGMRGPWSHPNEEAVSREHHATIWTMDALDRDGAAAAARRIVERVGATPVYVTFDIDVVDPAFAPATGTPLPGGLTSREAMQLLRGLAGVNLIGMDVVEVAPALAPGDETSLLAAHLLFEGLALLAARARR